ncbi:MAG: RCC1 domain-containing protein [Acidimicrobiales bacterium]
MRWRRQRGAAAAIGTPGNLGGVSHPEELRFVPPANNEGLVPLVGTVWVCPTRGTGPDGVMTAFRGATTAFSFARDLAPLASYQLAYWFTGHPCATPRDPGALFDRPDGFSAVFSTDGDGVWDAQAVVMPARPGYYCLAAMQNGRMVSWPRHFVVAPRWAASALAVGHRHCLMLLADRSVFARGGNELGQLGDGDLTPSPAGVVIPGLGGVISVAAGRDHSFAICGDSSLYAWGRNDRGQLGDPETDSNRTTPVEPVAVEAVSCVAGGGTHSLVVLNDGSVWAFGDNRSGQIGNGGDDEQYTTRVRVPGVDGAEAVVAGDAFSLALDWNGGVWAWGDNRFAQLAESTAQNRAVPALVERLPPTVALAAGGRHCLALDVDGGVWAWGDNSDGQCGPCGGGDVNGLTTPVVRRPVLVPGLGRVLAVAAGTRHSVAIVEDGTVWTWGANDQRQLSRPVSDDRSSPVQVTDDQGMTLSEVTAVAAGGDYSLSLDSTGRLMGWGRRPA